MPIFNNALAGASGATSGAAAGYEITRSLRFNSADSAYLSRTPSSAGNRKTWTWSGWVKRSGLGAYDFLFNAETSSVLKSSLSFWNGDYIRFKGDYNDGTARNFSVSTNALFRDPSAWYHVVCRLDTTQATAADRIKIWVNGVEQTFSSATYPTQNSDIELNNNSAHLLGSQTGAPQNGLDGYLADVHFIDGQALAPTDFGEYDDNNVWQPKEYSGSYGTNGFRLDFSDNSSNAALGTDSSGLSNTWTVNNLTATARNYTSEGTITGSFYDSAGGAASKMFDGSASTGAFSSSGTATFTFGGSTITASTSLQVRAFKGDSAGANVLVNGTDISSLLNAQSSGGYSTVDITSTLGGAPINLSNVSVVNAGGGSGNIAQIFVDGVELVDGSVSDIDSLIDTPTNYEAASGNNGGNYCTLNPLKNGQTLSNGNLDVVGGSSWQRSVGTLGMYSGKYYWEYTITASNEHIIGVGPVDMQLSGNLGAGSPPGSGYATEVGSVNGTGANGSWTNTGGSGAGDVIGIAFDADNGNMYVYKNGTALNSGIASHTGLAMPQVPVVSLNGSTRSGTVNFGQRPFAYTPPTGYLSLCTQNLTDPTIADGSTAFDALAYTGDGGTSRSITSLNFSPDLVWFKNRGTLNYHQLHDIVRGATKRIYTNATDAENTYTTALTSFDSNGWTMSNGTPCNANNNSYVAWTWDGGTSTVSNTDGSITSTVRANPSAGFSIVSYTGNGSAGATVGHGLNASPGFVIIKVRNGTAGWFVWHSSEPDKYLAFDTSAAVSNTGILPVTNSTIQFKAGYSLYNANTFNYIAYCFAPVEGYSAFGKYTGNGSTDGPFVYTGFRPAFLLVKASSAAQNWNIFDDKRSSSSGSNVIDYSLSPNLSNAEYQAEPGMDFVSNGFKSRNSVNTNGVTYVWAAFASHPFKTARAA